MNEIKKTSSATLSRYHLPQRRKALLENEEGGGED